MNDFLADFSIIGYIFAFFMWVLMGITHVTRGTKNSFSGIVLAFLWLWYAYKNYDFFFLTPGNHIDITGSYKNAAGVIVLDICSAFMAAPYFNMARLWIKRRGK